MPRQSDAMRDVGQQGGPRTPDYAKAVWSWLKRVAGSVIVRLADASGVAEFQVRDSDAVVVGSINSDGYIADTSATYCVAYRSAAYNVPNAAWTAIPFDAEVSDPLDMHSLVTNTTRVTIPCAGLYLIAGALTYAANAAGRRLVEIRVNGVAIASARGPVDSTNVGQPDLTALRALTTGDYVEAFAYQDSGAALALGVGVTYSWLAATRIA